MKINTRGEWKLYWSGPLPQGAEACGTVEVERRGTGALLRMTTGVYVMGAAGSVSSLSQGQVRKLLGIAPEPEGCTQDLHFRATPTEKATLEAAAKAERRTLSNYLLTAGLERAGRAISINQNQS